jgi:sugar lactone lactonase YvrE
MRMSAAPDVANAISALRASVRDVVRSDAFITLRDSTMFPEGMDIDARTGNVYVASIRHRTVLERRPDGAERELLSRGQPNLGGVFGVRVDPKGGVLWATTSTEANSEGATPGEPQIAALLQIRMTDGAILRRWEVPASPTGHTLGDLAVAAGGDVFVTDSRSPFVYRLRRGADTLETITNPLFRSLQGVAPTSDGRTLYLADYSHGLLRLDLETGMVRVLEHDPSFSVLGLDGIALYRGSIVAVQNGVAPARVVRYTLDGTGTRITKVTTLDRNPVADEPTIGAIANGAFVYVANSQWEKYGEAGARVTARPLTRPVLLRVPLW